MIRCRDYRSIFPLTIAETRKLLACVEEGPDGCWLWTGPLNANGYGRVFLRGRWWLSHRMMHELLVGPVGRDRVTHHRCRNSRCSNPEHLKSATQSDNIAEDYAARGTDRPRRLRSCCKNGHKFTEENIIWRRTRGRLTRLCRICRDATARRRNEMRKAQRAASAPRVMVGDKPQVVPRPSSPSADFHSDSGHFAPVGTQATEPLYRRPSCPGGDA